MISSPNLRKTGPKASILLRAPRPKRAPPQWKKPLRMPKVPEMRAPEMCGLVRSDGTTKWFPNADEAWFAALFGMFSG